MSEALTCAECGAKLQVPTAEPEAEPTCPNGHEQPDPKRIQT